MPKKADPLTMVLPLIGVVGLPILLWQNPQFLGPIFAGMGFGAVAALAGLLVGGVFVAVRWARDGRERATSN